MPNVLITEPFAATKDPEGEETVEVLGVDMEDTIKDTG